MDFPNGNGAGTAAHSIDTGHCLIKRYSDLGRGFPSLTLAPIDATEIMQIFVVCGKNNGALFN